MHYAYLIPHYLPNQLFLNIQPTDYFEHNFISLVLRQILKYLILIYYGSPRAAQPFLLKIVPLFDPRRHEVFFLFCFIRCHGFLRAILILSALCRHSSPFFLYSSIFKSSAVSSKKNQISKKFTFSSTLFDVSSLKNVSLFFSFFFSSSSVIFSSHARLCCGQLPRTHARGISNRVRFHTRSNSLMSGCLGSRAFLVTWIPCLSRWFG